MMFRSDVFFLLSTVDESSNVSKRKNIQFCSHSLHQILEAEKYATSCSRQEKIVKNDVSFRRLFLLSTVDESSNVYKRQII